MKSGAVVAACTFGLLVAAGVAYSFAERASTRVEDDVRRVCGGRARVVWCQQAEGTKRGALGSSLTLMGLDTAERGGPRPLLSRMGSYWKPMITPRGDRVVFTDFPSGTVHVVDWNGAGLREVGPGVAMAVWMEPGTVREWVYALEPGGREEYVGRPLVRMLLDNPSRREKVWDSSLIHMDNLRLSADGAMAGSLFPWPDAGVADLKAGTWQKLGTGCWPDLSPDNRYLLWVFDGSHRNLMFHPGAGREGWKVKINDAPGIDGCEVDCPRWSNRTRLMCMSGPRKRPASRDGRDAGDGGEEIHVGRFDKGLTEVEDWARVTRNEVPDYFADLWVEPTTDLEAVAVAGRAGPKGGRLVVQGRLEETSLTPTPESIAPYRNALVVYAYRVENVVTGAWTSPRLLVAHWGMVDGKRRAIPREVGSVYRMTVEQLDDRPELEGQRVIMGMKDDGTPIHYEVSP